MTYYLSAGFAKNYRTYIMAGVAAITAVAGWAVGDSSTSETLKMLYELALSGGLAALRAAVD